MLLIILIILILIAGSFNLFVYFLGKKIQRLEASIMTLFQKRNSEVVGIYQVSKDVLVKPKEVYEDFFELKRRDFWDYNYNGINRLEDKLIIYSKLHNEINFIFKTCEQHEIIRKNAIYTFLKESIQNKSVEIGDRVSVYNEIKSKYDNYKDITKFMIIGYLY